jgi:hypothetical protein
MTTRTLPTDGRGSKLQPEVEQAIASPDLSWRGIYRAGGIAAILYVVLSLAVPTLQVLVGRYDFSMDATTLLEFIGANRLWWMTLQTLVLGTSILAIVAFISLFVALKHLDKSLAALGAIVTVTCHLLFIAYYPVLLGLVYLSEQYAAAPEAQRAVYATAAEALLAQNNAFNPLYESLFGVGILLFSFVMLKGLFARWVAYLGMVTCVAAFVGLALWPVIGIGYFWWWLFFFVWFLAVGWKLYQLGGSRASA